MEEEHTALIGLLLPLEDGTLSAASSSLLKEEHLYPFGGAQAETGTVSFHAAWRQSRLLRALCRRTPGLGGYLLGDNVHRLAGPIGIVTVVLAVLLILAAFVIVRRNEQRLADEAERALPEQEGNMEVAQDFV